VKLTDAQRAVVEADDGPCRVAGGFGTGKTTALVARAEELRGRGQRPLVLGPGGLVDLAVDILRRHRDPATRRLDGSARHDVVARLAAGHPWPSLPGATDDPTFAGEVAATVLGFQASFLGDEELFVHADAAGQLPRWQDLAAFTARYLADLAERSEVDEAGALVQASLLLRDEDVCRSERERFDHLLVDDFQQATFATLRLVAQLVGRGGPVTVAGNPAATLGSRLGVTGPYFDRFATRFAAATDIALDRPFRSPGIPTLRLVEDEVDEEGVVAEAVAGGRGLGLEDADIAILPRTRIAEAMGREWPLVVVPGLREGWWPAPRSAPRWFDPELFGGPDVPDGAVRDARWWAEERRRFAIACSRATRFLVVTAPPPVSPIVGDLVSSP
jgi:superfamily I DNA/RNA helicase